MRDVYFVYHTLNVITYECYIGVTYKPKNSGYCGSGTNIQKALKKFGRNFFIRTDLFSGSFSEAEHMEKFYINFYNAVNRPDFYNNKDGGYNGKHSETTKAVVSAKVKKAWQDPETRAVYVAAFKKRTPLYPNRDLNGSKNGMFGKTHSDISRQKISRAKTGIKLTLTEAQRLKRKENIMKNEKLMGSKSNQQRAKTRWRALNKTFSKEPVIHVDMKMMHDFYKVNEKMEELSPDLLKAFLEFRFKFLQEEINEGVKAIEEKNADEIVDSLIDLIVVAAGTLDLYQVDFKEAWYRVLKANMNKQVGIKEGRPNPFGLPDLVKPPGWTAPTHADNIGLLSKIF